MHTHRSGFGRTLLAIPLALLLAFVAGEVQAGAKPKLSLAKASWSAKLGKLTVKGKLKGGTDPIELYDINGRLLGSATGPGFMLSLNQEELASVPCAIRATAGGVETVKKVAGAPARCAKAPQCSITTPAEGTQVGVGTETNFTATAKLKDRKAGPLKYEWDFAGGTMGELIAGSNPPAFKRPDGLSTSVQFVRDNSTYRVRFSATDALGRRCEDAVEIVVGHPPAGLPPKVAEQSAAGLGAERDGAQDDVVVLPFEDWTYQNLSDMKLLNNAWSSASPVANNVRAYAFRKDRLPVFLRPDEVELRYSAASNPADPVGTDSINSTSRNWPTTATLVAAALKKSDWWDIPTTDGEPIEKKSSYQACPWMMSAYGQYWGCGTYPSLDFITADEGYFKVKQDDTGAIVPNDPNTELGHGAYMPGRDNPYVANTPQSFSRYDATDSQFQAQLLPYTDIDDRGRVNPYSLIRVEAVAKGSGSVLAKTDGTVSISHDFHCRECHAKGKLAANPNAPHTSAAYLSTPGAKPCRAELGPDDPLLDKPQFFEAASDAIEDQEYAAALNYSSLHEFYDGMFFISRMVKGDIAGVNAGGHCGHHDPNDPDHGKLNYNSPRQCYGCHDTMLRIAPFNASDPYFGGEEEDVSSERYDPNYSISMHRFHAELQWNAGKTDIVREPSGIYARWDYRTKGSNNSTQTGSLFPIFDDQGKQLPMEQNCLRCHAGHREQLYRDRMYTAGVTCYDCHGDMMAVGQTFPKKGQDGRGADGKRDFNEYRVPWFDEPDCGSCHTGDANDHGNGFFSAGVLKTAFATDDLSATPLEPNRERFAIMPIPTYRKDVVLRPGKVDEKTLKVQSQTFRDGKDTHGNVACAACHGGAHAIWPNRDASANDNVTALELQGHAGHIIECNVCHTADAFKNEMDLDGGQYSRDPVAGILGGPHNIHPVNDPNWWKSAEGNVSNTDGTTYGGWHNNYARKPGASGEDQCAACHGSDHKGTRLSKSPVDRVFDFRGFDMVKLKKAGFKSKVVKVAAGSVIGCDTCHSVKLSFTGSPGH